MKASPNISNDVRYLERANELRDLKKEREKARPSLYILLAIVFGFMGLVLFPSGWSFLLIFLAVAAIPTALTGYTRAQDLRQRIAKAEADLRSFSENPTPAPDTRDQTVTAELRLAELQTLLEKDLITREEFDSKRKEVLNQL